MITPFEKHWQKKYTPAQIFSIWLIIIALIIVIFGYTVVHAGLWDNVEFVFNIFNDFYANVSSELVSIVLTILVLDRLNARRAEKERKEELIFQMGSDEAVTAKAAARMILLKGWLEDGSLIGADLSFANLRSAFLYEANLQNTNLWGSNLERADLGEANLKGANLWVANLQGTDLWDTKFDKKTILPDGSNWTPDTDMNRYTDVTHPDFWQPEWAKNI